MISKAPTVLAIVFVGVGVACSKHVALAEASPQPAASPVASQSLPARSVTTLSQEVKDVFERSRHAVVKIHGQDEHSDIYGTGFFIDPTGTLYTSYSVGGDAGNFTVEFGGKEYPAHAVVADVRSYIAILKVDMATPALPIGKSEDLEVATPVVTIGYPLDLPQTPSFGMVAGFDCKYLGRYFETRHLRVNLPAQRGEAGAPLLNLKGEVVGILVSSLENNSACYALPIEAAEKIRSDYVRFGEVRHGWIGANVAEAKTAEDGSRAEIADIRLGTPAADAGIKPGDILLQVGRTKVREPEDVLDASFFISAGDNVPITVRRGKETLTFTAQADFYPGSKPPPLMSEMGLSPMSHAIPLSLQAPATGKP